MCGKAGPRYLNRCGSLPGEPGTIGPFEVAPAALGLLVAHRLPIRLRHSDLDRQHIVERVKLVECLLLLKAHGSQCAPSRWRVSPIPHLLGPRNSQFMSVKPIPEGYTS